MIVTTIAFYLFSAMLIGAALMVIASRNPVHSVLFLILAFFNAAALMLIAGAEFLAMILVVVYVGAVAVLFLFVVMMLDIDFAELRGGFQKYLPIGAVVGVLLLAELAFALGSRQLGPESAGLRFAPVPAQVSNTEALGRLIYTDYVFLFQVAGLILLVAMIGAIVLTLRHRKGVLRQNIAEQVGRTPAIGMRIVQIKSGEGLKAEGLTSGRLGE